MTQMKLIVKSRDEMHADAEALLIQKRQTKEAIDDHVASIKVLRGIMKQVDEALEELSVSFEIESMKDSDTDDVIV